MQSEITTLTNGLRIITSFRPEIETVSLGIWVKTGSAYEKDDMNGISHFLEHMVFKGTTTRDTFDISEQFEDVGGQSNAYTSREFTSFFAKMLKGDTELALDILSDLLTHSTFPQEELMKEKEVVVQEIKQTIDTPDDIIFDYMQECAFPKQAVGRTILGPAEKVRSFTKENLQNYLKTNYAADNMVVCAVGNIRHQEFVKMVEKRLSNLQPKSNFAIPTQEYKGGFYAEKRDIEQAHVILAFKGIEYKCDNYYPCTIFSTIFGGGMTSRLFKEIREKRGLVYTIYSFTNSHTQDGLFGIYAGTTKNELRELLSVVCEEIKKICNEKITEKELNRAKIQLKASMLMALESPSSTADVLAHQMLIFNRIISVDEMIQRIEAVTIEDVQAMAQQIFSSNPTFTLIGDIEGHQSYDELLAMLKH